MGYHSKDFESVSDIAHLYLVKTFLWLKIAFNYKCNQHRFHKRNVKIYSNQFWHKKPHYILLSNDYMQMNSIKKNEVLRLLKGLFYIYDWKGKLKLI